MSAGGWAQPQCGEKPDDNMSVEEPDVVPEEASAGAPVAHTPRLPYCQDAMATDPGTVGRANLAGGVPHPQKLPREVGLSESGL